VCGGERLGDVMQTPLLLYQGDTSLDSDILVEVDPSWWCHRHWEGFILAIENSIDRNNSFRTVHLLLRVILSQL